MDNIHGQRIIYTDNKRYTKTDITQRKKIIKTENTELIDNSLYCIHTKYNMHGQPKIK